MFQCKLVCSVRETLEGMHYDDSCLHIEHEKKSQISIGRSKSCFMEWKIITFLPPSFKDSKSFPCTIFSEKWKLGKKLFIDLNTWPSRVEDLKKISKEMKWRNGTYLINKVIQESKSLEFFWKYKHDLEKRQHDEIPIILIFGIPRNYRFLQVFSKLYAICDSNSGSRFAR